MNHRSELDWYVRHEWQRHLNRPLWADGHPTEHSPSRRSADVRPGRSSRRRRA